MHRRLLNLLWMFLAGCYGHRAAHTPARVEVAKLPKSRSGQYELWRGGRQVGTERIRLISTSSAGWVMRGVIQWRESDSATARYQVRVTDREPRHVSWELDVMGYRRTLTATVSGGYVDSHVTGVGREVTRRVAYGRGTFLDLASPATRIWALGLLSPQLLPGASIDIRTIHFTAPALVPEVELQSLVVTDARDDVRLIRVVRPLPAPPEALWVAPDGFVVRARSWPRGLRAPLLERRWVPDP